MRTGLRLTALASCLAFSACVADEGARPYSGIGLQPEFYRPPVSRTCENYADQTARNSYENLSDGEDSFGTDAFNQRRAEREGNRAYERCRRGRLN